MPQSMLAPITRGSPRPDNPTERAPLALALLPALIGAVTLAGWVLGVSSLRNWTEESPNAGFGTGLGLVASGLAVALLSVRARTRLPKVVGRVLAVSLLGFGSLATLHHLTGWGEVFDQWVFRTFSPAMRVSLWSGWPSAPAAACFVVAGAALLLLQLGRRWSFVTSQVLVVTLGALAYFTAASYSYSGTFLVRAAISRPLFLSLPAAVGLGLLAVALLWAVPHRGIAGLLTGPSMSAVLARRLTVALLLSVPLVGLLVDLVAALGLDDLPSAFAAMASMGVLLAIGVLLLTTRALAQEEGARLAAEEALSRSEAHFRGVVENAPDAIFVSDADGRITDVNPAAVALLGLSRDAVLGRTTTDLISPAGPQERTGEPHARRKVAITSEWWLRRGDRWVPVELSMSGLPGGRRISFVRDLTARRRAEQDRALLATLVDSAEDAIVALTREGYIQTWNRGAQRIFGYSAEQARGEHLRLLAPAGQEGETEARLARVLHDGRSQSFEATRQRQDGTLVPVSLIAAPIREPDGAIVGVSAILRDETERRHAEERLRLSEARFRTALLHAPAVVWNRDQEGALAWIHRPQGAPAQEAEDVFPAADLEKLRELERRVLGSGAGLRDELRLDDGRAFDLTLEPLRGPGSEVLGVTGAAWEITQAVRTREELMRARESEARNRVWLQAVIDQMPEGVLLLDRGGRATWNRAALALAQSDPGRPDRFGNAVVLALEDAQGIPLAEEDLPWVRAMAGEEVSGVELVALTGEGRRVPLLVRAKAVHRNGVGGAVVVFQDISTFKQLEQMREEWVSIIAHDLRQPVTVVQMTADLLQKHRDALPARATALLDRLQSATARLERMIHDLLDFSRLEARRLALMRRDCDLRQVIQEAVDASSEATRGHAVRVVLRPGLSRLNADPDRIAQVLINLLSNAAKYGFTDTPIEVSAEQREGEVEVCVSNRGPGLTPADLSRLFQRFSRAAEPSAAPGTGLGLYIARGLVEAHGGRLWAESTPGEATHFRFTLPLAAAAGPQAAASDFH